MFLQTAGLRQQLTAAQAELADVLERSQTATSNAQQAMADRDMQAKEAKEVQL